METKAIYERLGDNLLRQMIDHFYDLILKNPITAPLFTTDMDVVKSKQYDFLTQFFGGPQRYSDKYGHPMMRARHLTHKIDRIAAEQWLHCMATAIDKLPIENEFKEEIFRKFPPVAAHMINSGE
jgi:hemoglobin